MQCKREDLLTGEQVKEKYKKAIKICHPDKLRGAGAGEELSKHGGRVFDALKKAFSKHEAAEKAYAVPDCP
jgi:curved DNA-binding protein CbpA